ncbi:hypothetical protein NS226_23935, partial [Aureimonas ureilytica]
PSQVANPPVAAKPPAVASRPAPAAAGAAPIKPAVAMVPPVQPAPAVRDTADPATACSRDEQRLARLRAEPSPAEIAKLQRELTCERLKAQVQRLLESVASDPPQPTAPEAPRAQQAQRQAVPAPQSSDADVCARDAARLAKLRGEASVEGVRTFEQERDCEQIRPQLQRLRESLGL